MCTIIDPRNCKHGQIELRCQPDKHGNKRYRRQCLLCGEPQSSWISKIIAEEEAPLDSIPLFDERLQQDKWQKFQQAKNLQITFELEQMKIAYDEYIKSKKWRQKADLVLKRADNICEGCGDRPATQVHHLSYENLGNELLWELVAICASCHDRSHPWKLKNSSSSAEAQLHRLHSEVEKSPLFRKQITKLYSDRANK